MQHRTPSPFLSAVFPALLAFGSLGLGACSLALDTQKAQCSKASDCDSKRGGSKTQLCVQGFCQAVTCEGETQKEADDSCRKRTERKDLEEAHCTAGICEPLECRANGAGGAECSENQACDIARNVCVDTAKAACAEDKDCAKYEGIEDHICENKLCAEPECRKDGDCTAVSDTASCVMGRCDDIAWGCTRLPDDREVPSSGTSTLRLRILSVGMAPLTKAQNLKVNVCATPGGVPCIPLASAVTQYDNETGWLEITGLAQRQPLWLEIKAEGMLPVDWYTQRVPVDVTEEPEPAVLVPVGLETAIGNQFMPVINVDLETKSTMIIRVYNCVPENAQGVSISISKPGNDTKIFYLDSAYQVLLDEQETDATGTSGIANAPTVGQRITVTRAGEFVTKFDLTPRPKVLTYLALYPNDYSKTE